MVIISQKESKQLQEAGFKFGKDLFHTIGKSKKKTYYAVETSKVLSKIEELRRV